MSIAIYFKLKLVKWWPISEAGSCHQQLVDKRRGRSCRTSTGWGIGPSRWQTAARQLPLGSNSYRVKTWAIYFLCVDCFVVVSSVAESLLFLAAPVPEPTPTRGIGLAVTKQTSTVTKQTLQSPNSSCSHQTAPSLFNDLKINVYYQF